jgi:two-component system, cell cycle sensor histidine kinase and response regulator CckA
LTTGDSHNPLSASLSSGRRLQLLEQLARGIAHDVNTQLTAVLGFADLTAADPDLPEALRADVQQISLAAQRAGVLTARLQTYCRLQPSGTRVVDLDEVIAASRPARERLGGPRLELVDEPAPALTLVAIEPAQLQWFLLDVVARARDALPDGGQLRFTTTHADDCARLAITGAGEPVVLSLPFTNA